ncbi:MAG: DegV family protein [Clostridiaceae bacterium]|nr:DegV family protein [Clostridiaceae bacterium]
MTKIKIFVDSASDITKEEAEKYDITVVPLTVTFDGENFIKDFYDFDHDEFYNRMISSPTMPKTSQVPPHVFKEYFEKNMEGYDCGICFTLSGVSSGTCQSAKIAADELWEEKGIDIKVVDTHSFSYVYGGPVVLGAKMAQEGKDRDEIIKTVLDLTQNTTVYFLVGDIEFLKKGGRINLATLVIGKLLEIRPVLTIKDGLIAACDKIRGNKKLADKLLDIFEKNGYDLNDKDVIIEHSCLDLSRVEETKEALYARYKPRSLTIVKLGATIGSHAGPNVTAFLVRG